MRNSSGGMWQSTPTPNLIRWMPKGTYYLRARVKGAIVRKSLRTTVYRAACVKLQDRLRSLRLLAGAANADDAPRTLGEALALVRAKIEDDPSLKSSSRRVYLEEMDALSHGGAAAVPATPLAKLSRREIEAWWGRVAATYASQRANHSLMFVRWAVKVARRCGSLADDPTEDLKGVPIPRTRLQLVTPAQLREIAASIRQQRTRKAAEAGDWVEFMAYSGLRPGEMQALLWSHIDDEAGFILVMGGEERTKNREDRRVPIIPPMRELLARMREKERRPGKVFSLKNPDVSLQSACKRLGLPRQKIYNLRHLFATTCAESGVAVPTFAQWLGHKDGGKVALRTYVQRNDAYSQQAAAKVTFL